MEHLRVVIKRIADHGLKLKVPKCSFTQRSVKLLGNVVNQSGVYVDPEKM